MFLRGDFAPECGVLRLVARQLVQLAQAFLPGTVRLGTAIVLPIEPAQRDLRGDHIQPPLRITGLLLREFCADVERLAE